MRFEREWDGAGARVRRADFLSWDLVRICCWEKGFYEEALEKELSKQTSVLQVKSARLHSQKPTVSQN